MSGKCRFGESHVTVDSVLIVNVGSVRTLFMPKRALIYRNENGMPRYCIVMKCTVHKVEHFLDSRLNLVRRYILETK